MAPDTTYTDTTRQNKFKTQLLTQFSVHSLELDQISGANITSLVMDTLHQQLLIGTATGKCYSWTPSQLEPLPFSFSSPVSWIMAEQDHWYVTEMGTIFPSDQPLGKLWKMEQDRNTLLLDQIVRPVHFSKYQRSPDSQPKLIISEYGHSKGKLFSTYIDTNADSVYQSSSLLSVPGFIRSLTLDADSDGDEDIIGLAAQGNEGIFLFLSQDDGVFRAKQLLQFPPESGF